MDYPTEPLPDYHLLPNTEAFDALHKRLCTAAGCASECELAAFLETTPPQISAARQSLRCPVAWLQSIFLKTRTNPIWILEGIGDQYL